MANTPLTDIILDAYRESNLTNINSPLTDAQQTEGLRLLLRVLDSVYGNEVGENFASFPVGKVDVTSPPSFPPTFPENYFFPLNIRIPLNTDAPRTIFLHPDPQDGSRFAVVDENSTVLQVTIDANGRRIEGQPSYFFDTPQGNREWIYDAHNGEWNLVSPLTIDDLLPFPKAFDDFFVIGLAMRLNPRYTQQTDPDSIVRMKDVSRKIKARYAQTIETHSELAYVMTPGKRPQAGYYYGYVYGSPTDIWNSGYPFIW